eukprot:5486817-Pleurochrysis_carterae.AAC.1
MPMANVSPGAVARRAGRKSARLPSIDIPFERSGQRNVSCAPRSRSPLPAATSRVYRRRDNRRAVSASTSRPLP